MDYKVKDNFLISLLDAIGNEESEELKIVCNKGTLDLLIEYTNRLETIPTLLTKYRGNINFAGISVSLDDSIKSRCIVIEPTGKLMEV